MARYQHIENEQVEAARISMAGLIELSQVLRNPEPIDALTLGDARLPVTDIGVLLASRTGDWVVRDSAGDVYAISDATFQDTYVPLGPAAPTSASMSASMSAE